MIFSSSNLGASDSQQDVSLMRQMRRLLHVVVTAIFLASAVMTNKLLDSLTQQTTRSFGMSVYHNLTLFSELSMPRTTISSWVLTSQPHL